MEKQQLSRLLGNIACGLDYWYQANQSQANVAKLEALLSAAFHDASHLVPLERFLSEVMPDAALQFKDIPARLVPRCLGPDCEPIPPTQRTVEEPPTKTQVDQEKPEPHCGDGLPCKDCLVQADCTLTPVTE